jgi:hypothetical protein
MMQQQEQQEYLLEESLDSTSANFFGVSLDSETSEVMEAREMAMMDGDLY